MTLENRVRTDIEFRAEDGTVLHGWLYRPAGDGPHPIVVMAHGFSGVKGSLTKYADLFSAAALAVLLYDHRGFGSSDGAIRQDINPHQQVADFRDAITFAQSLPGIDSDRIGVWGSSYAGGHAIALGASDRRVKCVVSQVPMISGHATVQRMFAADQTAIIRKRFAAERLARLNGATAETIPVFSTKSEICAIPPAVSARFIKASEDEDPLWQNEVTLRSLEYMGEYEPGALIRFVSPTPFLLIVGIRDTVTPVDLALEAYERALEPKKLVIYPGGHFSSFYQNFEQTSSEARDWFVRHLVTPAEAKATSP
jgi:fermentation-respiration switch protein FrsA (DUF1100 family)